MIELLLIAGAAGAPTRAFALETVRVLRDEGARAVIADASTVPGTTSMGLPIAQAWNAALGEIGGDPVVDEAWQGFPGAHQVAVLSAAAGLLAENDVVVVDVGDVDRLRDLLALPAAMQRLLDSAMTPRLAMWRGSSEDADVFERFSVARAAVLRLVHVLDRATVRIVTPAEPDAADVTLRTVAVASMLGVPVDGIAVTGTARSGAPSSVRARDRALLRSLRRDADGAAVWKAGRRMRVAPKGASVEFVGGSSRVLAPGDARAGDMGADEAAYAWDLALAPMARARARVGVTDECVVVEFDGAFRWLELPPVLKRCVATRAVRVPGGIRVEFAPDPATWRAGAA
jgi:arsenite-transporting ATPase